MIMIIHDPKYFVLTWNNAYFPVTFLDSNPNTTNDFYIKFDLVEVMCMHMNGKPKLFNARQCTV